jgi:hypothetical protein
MFRPSSTQFQKFNIILIYQIPKYKYIYYFFFKHFLTMDISQKIGIATDVFCFSSSSKHEEMHTEISKVMKVNFLTVSNFITTVV